MEEKKILSLGMTKKEMAGEVRKLREFVEFPNFGIQDKIQQIAKFMKIVEELLEARL